MRVSAQLLPEFAKRPTMHDAIYLDNAATTRTDPAIAAQLAEDSLRHYANPASTHRAGLAARRRLEQARETIAERLPGYRVVFTASGTEAIHLAIRGAFGVRPRRRRVLVSAVEHPAVLRAAEALVPLGAEVETIAVDAAGRVDTERLEARLAEVGEQVAVCAVMAVQNELGTIEPLERVRALLARHAPQAFFFVDAVQALGKIVFDPETIGAHAYAFASHKIHGPKGMGCLAVREPVHLAPLLTGGGQEFGLRSGTPDVPGACGFATAFVEAFDHAARHVRHLESLRAQLAEGIARIEPGAVVHGPGEPGGCSPSILSVAFPGRRGEQVQHALEAEGLYCSTGSACHSAERKPGHVLRAVGMDPVLAEGTVRFGLSWTNTEAEIERALEIIAAALPRVPARATIA
ncbi:MAG: cysteine desulfurase [Planctomycetota bacterium]|nr:MAG: cysteine desulfurase [Planctomycetota bacterium]